MHSVLMLAATATLGAATGRLRQSEVEVDVLVLGAGMAGVKAAATLYKDGIENFLVLEQSDRIGGRMWRTEWDGQTIELGANWIEGIPQDENPIWGIAKQIGLQGNYTDQEGSKIEPTLYDANGKIPSTTAQQLHKRVASALNGAMRICCEHHQHGLGDMSLREAMTKSGWPTPELQTPLERTLEFFVVDWDFEYPPEEVSIFNYFDVGHAGSWHEMCTAEKTETHHFRHARTAARMGMLNGFIWESPRYFVTDPRGYAAVAEFVASPWSGQRHLSIEAPSQSSVNSLGSSQPKAQRLLFNQRVTNIEYSADSPRVRVETADGVFRAKYAILTFSSGVVNHAVESQELFHPPLPAWKADAYGKARNGIYTKIFLRYNEKFWDNADYILFADPHRRGFFAVWQDMESHGKFFPEGANILMVTVVQADSLRVEAQPKNTTVQEVQAVLRHMYGEDVPEPLDIFVPVWSRDPAFYGCWSNIAVGTSKHDFELMQEPVGGLFFAGEATDYDYNGFVAGGYHSGHREAKKVLQALRESSSLTSLSSMVSKDIGASLCILPSAFFLISLCALRLSCRRFATVDSIRAPMLDQRGPPQ